MSQETLVGISGACHILGVSETALRQWTDEAKIKAFITPGGHRRYSVADLKKFMGSHQRAAGIRQLAAELEDSVQPLREIARTSLSGRAWYNNLGTDSQQHLSVLGRSMLQAIIKYATEPANREETINTAHLIGSDFGVTLAAYGLSLTDSVEAFILHRDPIMNAAARLMKSRDSITGRVAEAIPSMGRVMDEALIYLVTAHQQQRNVIRTSKGRAA